MFWDDLVGVVATRLSNSDYQVLVTKPQKATNSLDLKETSMLFKFV